jgi:hypothetical protein
MWLTESVADLSLKAVTDGPNLAVKRLLFLWVTALPRECFSSSSGRQAAIRNRDPSLDPNCQTQLG